MNKLYETYPHTQRISYKYKYSQIHKQIMNNKIMIYEKKHQGADVIERNTTVKKNTVQ